MLPNLELRPEAEAVLATEDLIIVELRSGGAGAGIAKRSGEISQPSSNEGPVTRRRMLPGTRGGSWRGSAAAGRMIAAEAGGAVAYVDAGRGGVPAEDDDEVYEDATGFGGVRGAPPDDDAFRAAR